MSIDHVGPMLAQLEDKERADRLQRFHRAWLAYQGDAPTPFSKGSQAAVDNVRLNFNRQIVDKGVAFLFGKPLHFALGKEGDADAEKLQGELAAFWQASGGRPTFRKLGKNGAITGHAWVKLQPAEPYPRVIVLDPSNVEVIFDDEDIDRVLEYRLEWIARDKSTGRITVRRQRFIREETRWEIVEEVSEESGAYFREIERKPWAYEWAPIFGCQNLEAPNEFWGRADLEPDVLDLIEAMEKVASDMKRVVRLYGHPRPWVSGANLDEVDASIDSILRLPAGAAIGQLELGASLEGPLRYWQELKGVLHELTREPEVASGKVENIGNLSGVALEILYQPKIEKNEEKRDSYGELLRDVSQRGLELMGHGPEHRPSINWPEVLPADPQREMAALDTAETLGVVSKQTVAERLGFDYEQERRRIEAEAPTDPSEVPEL